MLGLRPFFCYFGGKWRAAPKYPPPRYDVIVEPFAGAAGYSTRYYERQVILIDRDPNIVKTWEYLIRVDPEEILSLPLLEAGQSLDDFDLTEDQKRLVGWWLNKGTFAPCKIPSAWMRGGTRPNSYWGETIRERITEQVQKIRHWQIFQGSYSDVEDNPEVTWYVDPPYQIAGKNYRFSEVDYSHLAAWCRARNGQVIVCENLGADWLSFRSFADIRGTPGKRRSGVSKEGIWTNEAR